MTRSSARTYDHGGANAEGTGRAPRSMPRTAKPIAMSAVERYTSQIANFSSHWRTTAKGPPRASAATTMPKAGTKAAATRGSMRPVTMMLEAMPITSSSNAAHPSSWNTFSTVGAYDPMRPRTGRRLTIVGTPARLP